MNYKGFVIKDLTATPESFYQNSATIARGYKFSYCKGDIIDEGARDAKTLDEAAAEIDELTANDPTPEDKLKIAVQCIEANREEFQYRATHAVDGLYRSTMTHQAQLCTNAINAINLNYKS